MKPKLLKITGLNSFEDEQIVDFEKLTSKGLFGIFGSTGSGKTTIIDAITMSLYGQMPRFGEGKPKQCININRETMHLSFHFTINEDLIIVERSYKKNGQSMLSTSARVYTEKDGKINVLAEKTQGVNEEIIKRIGLNYKDFSRSVVLPQGKFSDFLLLANVERREMLERIFGLEKYGDVLYKKIKSQLTKINSELDFSKGDFDKFQDITQESLEREKVNLAEGKDETGKYRIVKNKMQETLNEFEKYLEDKNEHEKFKTSYTFLEDKKLFFSAEKKRLEMARKAAVIKPLINSLNEKTEKIVNIDAEIIKKTEENEILNIDHKIKKEEFESSSKSKEEDYPKLLEMQNKTKQAIELSTELVKLNFERNSLLKEYNEKKIFFENLCKDEKQVMDAKNETKTKLEKISLEKQDINKWLEQRKQVTDAFNISLKYNETSESLKQISEKYLAYEMQQKQEASRKFDIENEIKTLHEKILELEERQNKLEINKPISHEKILEKQSQFIEIENIFKIFVAESENLFKLESKIREKKDALNENEDLFNIKNKEILTISDKIQQIKRNLEEILISNISKQLVTELQEGKECPICGSKNHPKPAETMKALEDGKSSSELAELEQILEQKTEDCKNISAQIISLKNELNSHQQDYKQLFEKINEFDVAKEKVNIEKMKTDISQFKNNLITWEEEKQQIGISLKTENEKLNSRNIILAGANEKFENIGFSLQESLMVQNKLMQEIKPLKIELSNYETILKTANFEELYRVLEAKDKRLLELEMLESEIRKELSEIEINEKKINNKISVAEKHLEKTKTMGYVNRNSVENVKEKIMALSGEEPPEKKMLKINNEIEVMLDTYNKSYKSLEKTQQNLLLVEKELNNLNSNRKVLFSIAKKEEEDLKDSLVNSGFQNQDEITNVLMNLEEMANLDKQIEAFHKDLNENASNLDRLSKKLRNVDLDNLEKNIEESKKISIEMEINLEEKIKNIVLSEKNILKMQEILEERKNYLEKRVVLLKKQGLLEDLADLLEGRKFIEYMAKRHLKYIVVEASIKLKEMTSMRYALELDEADFVVRDDFNGGARRSPKTLSGGEIFMVSLCLALALSSKMQLKSNAPLEFFFLDEGFGTLDPYLIDVVMNSLERLQKENLSIGIITHVEELKNRVPIKLLVTPATQSFGGSEIVNG